ncbi:MAG: hypothetical protein RL107_135 [Actinomycetota bacterium]|jgi:hypothetical protein
MVTKHGGEPQLRAVVHIGPIKTGSTAFTKQMTASQEHGELGETVVYALPRAISLHNQSRIIIPEHIRHLAPKLGWNRQSGESRVARTGSQYVVGARAYLDDLANDLRARAKADTTVFFVEETLSRRPSPGDLSSELLVRFDAIDYVFVARAQQFIVPSAIGQRLKGVAHPSEWDARVSSFLSNENLANQFDYASILDCWESRDPRVRVIVVPFLESDRGTQNLFHRILTAVGVRANLGAPAKSEVNATLTRFEIAAIGLYKKVAFRSSRKRFQRNSRQFRAYEFARIAFARIARIIRSPRWEVHPQERMEIVSFYQPSNLRFRESLGAEALSSEWTEWFRYAGIHDN